MTEVSIERAVARARATEERLTELRVRLRRLDEGESATREDVVSARRRAAAQKQAVAAARRRLLERQRTAAMRHEERARQFAEAGRPERADLERQAARRQLDAFHRSLFTTSSSPVGSPATPGDQHRHTSRPVTPSPPPGAGDELHRLRAGLVALMSWGYDAPLDDVDRRSNWCRAVVRRCGEPGWRGWAQAVCDVAAARLPLVRGAAVVVAGHPGVDVVAVSDPWTARVQELELVLGEGPASTARDDDRIVLVEDLSAERDDWQGYASATHAEDLRGVDALPLRVRGACVGTLTLYRWTTAPPTRPDLPDLVALADVATSALLADLEGDGAPPRTGTASVNVAAGFLSAHLGIPVREAEARIRARAFSTGQSLAVVAEDVLEGLTELE